MAKTKSKKPPFIGTWRINEMELWDKAAIDLVENGYIRFDEGETGEFFFIAVHGFTFIELRGVQQRRYRKAKALPGWGRADNGRSSCRTAMAHPVGRGVGG